MAQEHDTQDHATDIRTFRMQWKSLWIFAASTAFCAVMCAALIHNELLEDGVKPLLFEMPWVWGWIGAALTLFTSGVNASALLYTLLHRLRINDHEISSSGACRRIVIPFDDNLKIAVSDSDTMIDLRSPSGRMSLYLAGSGAMYSKQSADEILEALQRMAPAHCQPALERAAERVAQHPKDPPFWRVFVPRLTKEIKLPRDFSILDWVVVGVGSLGLMCFVLFMCAIFLRLIGVI